MFYGKPEILIVSLHCEGEGSVGGMRENKNLRTIRNRDTSNIFIQRL